MARDGDAGHLRVTQINGLPSPATFRREQCRGCRRRRIEVEDTVFEVVFQQLRECGFEGLATAAFRAPAKYRIVPRRG
jgi:hypothetical protein